MDNQSQFFYSSIFKISISPKNYHFSSLDWAFKLICEKSGYGGGPLSDKKYYFVQNTRPGHTFYEQGVVDGEKQRKFIDAGDSRPIGVIILGYAVCPNRSQKANQSLEITPSTTQP